jgi:5'-nucleotidase (lipoprotein e(P4) family)
MMPIRWTLLAATAAFLAGCAPATVREAPTAPSAISVPAAHDNLNATAWMQSAAEYEANVRGTFAAALVQLDAALADRSWDALPESERSDGFESRPPAIIVDADETMIDNSPFQARGVRDGVGYEQARWVAWVNERRARAMPGALEFAQAATERGVTIYFITNRDAPTEGESTLANLRALGFPVAADGSNLLPRGDARAPARDKTERRRWVGARHRVVMMLGDNLGDFLEGASTTVAARQALIAPYAQWWGRRWFMLPNPSYGSWESALLAGCDRAKEHDGRSCKLEQLRID